MRKHLTSIAALGPAAAHADRRTKAAGDSEPAIAAAAADGLSDKPGGPVAGRLDRTAAGNIDQLGATAGVAAAADTHGYAERRT
ncbi:hypothetical protein [Mesorhizobium sp. PAMC28654]|uniref:hypothetical protein n=1 Tax=Mesorhizobium sp. PAMC28654 TaxID=2880934 RepID=UPI002221C813|nr:hypothetical protein [Mesorhizobium sp. PAMC28654]